MIINNMTSSVDPDDMAHYKPSHLDQHSSLFAWVYVPVYRVERVKELV